MVTFYILNLLNKHFNVILFCYPELLSEIRIEWTLDMYTVSEGDNVTLCARIVGTTDIFPQVTFMTTTLSSDSGKITIYENFIYFIRSVPNCSNGR